LVVEPTHLKNMLVKWGSSSPNSGENEKIFETTTWNSVSQSLRPWAFSVYRVHGFKISGEIPESMYLAILRS